MKKYVLLTLPAILLLLSFVSDAGKSAFRISAFSAVKKTPVTEVNVNGRYSMMLPEYMTKDSTLNNEASLQYSNLTKEVYIIVIDEPTVNFVDQFKDTEEYDKNKSVLENYADVQVKSILGVMSKVTSTSEMRKLKTGCGSALVYDLTGYVEGIEGELGYTAAFIQGRLNLYFILTWTFRASVLQYQSDMDGMIKSFKEISGAIDTYPYCINSGRIFLKVTNDMVADATEPDATVEYTSVQRDLRISITESYTSDWDSLYANSRDSGQTMLQFVTEYQVRKCKREFEHVHDVTAIKSGSGNGIFYKSFTLVAQPDEYEGERFYKFKVVRGDSKFYILKCSTALGERKQNEKDMDFMLNSFNEL